MSTQAESYPITWSQNVNSGAYITSRHKVWVAVYGVAAAVCAVMGLAALHGSVDSKTQLFSSTAVQASSVRVMPSGVAQRRSQALSWGGHGGTPQQDPANFASAAVGAQDPAVMPQPPLVGSQQGGPAAAPTTLMAALGPLVVPGLAIVAIFGVFKIFKNQIFALLGIKPTPPPENPLFQSGWGQPGGAQAGGDPWAQFQQQQGFQQQQQNPFGAPPQDPAAAQQQAALDALLANASPEEAAQLRSLAEKINQRPADQAAPNAFGAAPADPFGANAAKKWVTPEAPAAASPFGGGGLTPEQKREQARQKAREMAGQQATQQVQSDTMSWAERQERAEKVVTGQAKPQDDFEKQLEADAKTVAVASVVLTAFVVAEAQAQGYNVQDF